MSLGLWLIGGALFAAITAAIVASVAAVSWHRRAMLWRSEGAAICNQDRSGNGSLS